MYKKFIFMICAAVFLGAPAFAIDWSTDKAHSSVNFEVSHLVISTVTGAFTDFEGKVSNFDGKDLTNASVEFTVQTTSVNTQNENRDKHLRSEDFFDVAKFPTMTFKSKKVIPGEGKKFQIVGDLTIKETTKEVTFDCVFNGAIQNPFSKDGGMKAGFSAKTTINRQDYKVTWNRALDGGGFVAGDDIDIIIQLELNQVMPEKPAATPGK